MKTTIYYSVENCGDGTAYPRFFESDELADWHQEHLSEGWGESCTGSIDIESDGPIKSDKAAFTSANALTDKPRKTSKKKVSKKAVRK